MTLHYFELAVSILLIAFALFTNTKNKTRQKKQWIKNAGLFHLKSSVYHGCFCFLYFIFAFLICYKADTIPTAYHVDEAGAAYDAINIAKYGIDRYLYKYPVYFINFGGGQNALYTYLAAILIKIFGYSIIIVRLPAIILSLISAFCFSKLVQKKYGETASLISIALHCILPFSIMHSRWALESYLLYPMLIISCCVLFHAIHTGKPVFFLAAGILMGITLYSYAISYLLLVFYLALLLPVLFYFHKITWENVITLGIPLFLLALPLLLMLAVNNGMIEEIKTDFFSIPKLEIYRGNNISLQNIITNLQLNNNNLFYRIFFSDGLRYNAIPRFGTLYPFSIPLILTGFLKCLRSAYEDIKKKKLSTEILIILLFIASLLTSLLINEININRSCEIFFPLIYFLITGLLFIIEKSKTAAILTAGAYMLLFMTFTQYYYSDNFRNDIKKSLVFNSIDDYTNALRFINQLEDKNPKRTFVVGRSEAYIYTLLALDIDSYHISDRASMTKTITTQNNEYHFLQYIDWDNLPDDNYYIFRDNTVIPWRIELMDFHTKDFGIVKVFYPIIDETPDNQ